ncbi:MAG: acyloxyacyl hydrolase [Aureispira sp.]|nr:acyloxyacyl hydrolase [Aureispira sp.]
MKLLTFFSILLFCWHTTYLQAQIKGIETAYQAGYSIPTHPLFPSIQTPSHSAELSYWFKTGTKCLWHKLYKYPEIHFSATFQTLGNDKILGHAIGVIPNMSFNIYKKKRFDIQARIGWGLAYITKYYDNFTNPQNIALGSNINAYARAHIHFRYKILNNLRLGLGLGISHYSNGGFSNPNLGVNIAGGQIGLQYIFSHPTPMPIATTDSTTALPTLPKGHKTFRPYLSIGLGFTEKGFKGPKYPTYVASAGVSRLFGRISKVSAGIEYVINMAQYEFHKHNSNEEIALSQVHRFSVFFSHELLFGNFGFYTGGGVYLNKHLSQRSIITAKIGFNFYLHNYFKRVKHQLWAGFHVRTYFGEAEFIEFVLGYNW